MKEIKPTYVSFSQAKALKEKGFSERVRNYYTSSDILFPSMDKVDFNKCNYYSAPEQWVVIEWLRVNHGIWIEITRDKRNLKWSDGSKMDTDGFNCTIVNDKLTQIVEYNPENYLQGGENIGVESSRIDFWKKHGVRLFLTPQEATSAAIDYVLEKLI